MYVTVNCEVLGFSNLQPHFMAGVSTKAEKEAQSCL